MTATDICTAALSLIGRLGPGRVAGPVELSVSFGILQTLMESLGLDRTLIYQVIATSYPLTGGTGTYTLGPNGSLLSGGQSVRPVFIESANMVVTTESASDRRPLKILNQQEFAAIATLADQSTVPKSLYNDYGFPVSNLTLYPIPLTSSHLELYTWTALQAFVALTDTFSMPPGYFRLLKTALALELAAPYSLQPSAALVKEAADARAAVIARNAGIPSPAQAMAPAPAAAGDRAA